LYLNQLIYPLSLLIVPTIQEKLNFGKAQLIFDLIDFYLDKKVQNRLAKVTKRVIRIMKDQ